MRLVCVAALAILQTAAFAEERHRVVVTAAPPVDAERLAEAMRAYLDEFAVDVVTAPASNAAELRAQLDATGAVGDHVRAMASIRVADAAGGFIEIALVDRTSGKSLVAAVPRPPRDADLYRTVALKVQALLRSSLYEQHETLAAAAPALSRLVVAPAAPPRARRLSLEAGYAVVALPAGGVVEQGVALAMRLTLRPHVELGLGVDVVAPARAARDDVTATLFAVPISVRAAVRGSHGRFAGAVGAVAELLVVALDPASPSATVRANRTAVPGLGAELAGAVRLTPLVSLFVRGSVVGLFDGPRYMVRGATLFDVSQLQVGAGAGLAVALW